MEKQHVLKLETGSSEYLLYFWILVGDFGWLEDI